MEKRKCRKCGKELQKTYKGWGNICLNCHVAKVKEWRKKNKEKAAALSRKYYDNHRKQIKEYCQKKYQNNKSLYVDRARGYRQKLRKEVIMALGGKCVECGFSDWRALQIDHINGNGKMDRMRFDNKLSKYYRYLLDKIRKNDAEEYQLLCANHNWIKKYENREEYSPNMKVEDSFG